MFILSLPVPSQPPTNLTSSDVTSSSLAFYWDQPPCGSRHGFIDSYSFTLEGRVPSTTGELGTYMTTIEFQDLQADTVYVFAVAAGTAFGIGPYAEITETTGLNGNGCSQTHYKY